MMEELEMSEDLTDGIPSQSESLATSDLLVSHKILRLVFIFSVGMATLCLVVSVAWLISYQYTILHEAHSIMAAASDTFYPDFVIKSQM
ncbi:MAG: hypothetical protein WBP93_04225, partial [Pyrinomonadaceae bacterium]